MDQKQILKQIYGFQTLRPGQEAIVEAANRGEDILALLPTGGGKSLCYQLPVLTVNGRALVITPLVSLMEDQVAELKRLKIKAVCIHSHLDIREKRMILDRLQQYHFIFCSPEWLATDRARAFISAVDFTHIIIDEAHCLSEWGYDFRPHYLLLNELLDYYAGAQVIALTATANDKTIHDIQHLLHRRLHVIDNRTVRENIFLKVLPAPSARKMSLLKELLWSAGPSIIYFSSKRMCDDIHQQLTSAGFKGMTYHADMSYEDRMGVQLSFQNDSIQYVCATSAFGMGINKKNIRTVIHYHVPKSMFQYVQEIGRAGRDGEQSQAILLFNAEDLNIAYRFLEEDRVTEQDLILYRDNIRLSEEKQESISILLRRFSYQELERLLTLETAVKYEALRAMTEYGAKDHCLTSRLYDVEEGCRHCQVCVGDQAFSFQTVLQQKTELGYKEYINSLFPA
ncbi:ATP-dependent DNA helicase RecQ [Macrococcus equipercicus]|uniref:ATP-dependent DNA helicase RecQ n=1 Tax=Macrococcus equipercicus TaxID=69967 RepID=A0ABQ6RA12_9STAP|nr:RecQ family ATP-dependent DNA helicase [Macrococcus equipercicus]KAA1040171.1 ATP-dependent DNA helicase RecQ [Macrococcus equipercicus]